MPKIIRSILFDLLRNRSLWAYTLFLLASSLGLFYIEGHDDKAVLSILNVIMLVVPSFSLIFSIIYYFNSIDFILLLLAQPVKRRTIMLSFIAALSAVFVLASWCGVCIPLMLFVPGTTALAVATAGTYLPVIFVSLAVLTGVYTREKSHGLGWSLALWFYFILIFDGIVLLLMYTFSEYPMEKIALYITFLNPVDLARVMTLMHTDAAALMGYTGAVFQKFFNAVTGTCISISVLTLWAVMPMLAAIKKFNRKSF